MVPWLAATTPKGLRIKSTILWDVSTFPPTTAEFLLGDRILSDGMMISTGVKQPEFNGIDFAISDLKE